MSLVLSKLPVWEEKEINAEAMPFKLIYGIRNNTLSTYSKSMAILYGIFFLKIQVDQFPTEEEFLLEVLRKCEEIVPLERRKELLKKLALNISANVQVTVELIAEMFGIGTRAEDNKISMPMTKKAFERIEAELAALEKLIQLQSALTSSQSVLSKSTKNVLIVASVVAVAIGGFFLFKRRMT